MAFNDEVDQIYLGAEKSVRRAARAAGVGGDWSPAATWPLFTITGGPVRITSLFGHVIALFAGTATPTLWYNTLTPTASALCTIAVAHAWTVNEILAWDGLLGSALIATIGEGHGQTTGTNQGFAAGGIICLPGSIDMINGIADATGQVDWYLTYQPLRAGAIVTPIP